MIQKNYSPKVEVMREDVAKSARAIGISEGDTVMFHSSLKSMGTVVGGPNTVIDGLLDAVGEQGTVAAPTLCNWMPNEKSLVFKRWDPKTTPSHVGAITEAFRLRPDSVRSDHATHSVAAIGARAKELTDRHGASGPRPGPYGDKAFAKESPWQKFYDWNAAYCFIGVNFRVNTMVHYVETLVVERALERCPVEERENRRNEVAGWMKPGVWPNIQVEDREFAEKVLTEQGFVQKGKIGTAPFLCVRARPMVDQWLKIIEKGPERWFPRPYCYLDWLEKIRLKGIE